MKHKCEYKCDSSANMKISILIRICDLYEPRYDTIDTFMSLEDDDDDITVKIMKKYPSLNNIKHGYDEIVFDQFTGEKYLIVTTRI